MLTMRLELRQTCSLECAVCRVSITEECDQDRVTAALVGAKKYAVCNLCGRDVTHLEVFRDRAYRQRWARRAAKGQTQCQ